jgi:hypothetical protein
VWFFSRKKNIVVLVIVLLLPYALITKLELDISCYHTTNMDRKGIVY